MHPEKHQDATGVGPPSFGGLSLQAQRAALAIIAFIDPIREAVTQKPSSPMDPIPDPERVVLTREEPFRVGIVGAGVAGLFTAMIFDFLRDVFRLEVDYEILEARGKDRLGGRLYSHYFKSRPGQPEIGPHDYYDVGAMRFPGHSVMKRVFKLFEVLDMEKHTGTNAPEKGTLIPYYLKDLKQPSFYNGIQVSLMNNPLTARTFNISGLPESILDKNAHKMVSDAIEEFTREYNSENPKKFWDKIIKDADPYSVRQYLMQIKKYDFNTVQFLETVNYGDGWYNQALTEMILEAITFGLKADWWCIEGGAQEIACKMFDKIKQKENVQFGKKVVAMTYVGEREKIDVQVSGETTPRRYDAVFNSAPLGAMQRMQLEGLNLSWPVKLAIRSLGYGASCKVGVRFQNLWWKDFDITSGGAAKTDLPIRQCVYPSYNVRDDKNKPGVLLVSYCWSQEAERLGSLIDRRSPDGEDELKEVLIHDLARLHAKTQDDEDFMRVRRIIASSYLDHFAYDWSTDPYSTGAFAYFGPGQFASMFQGITASNGKHVIIGEAASAHHAWVVGALESAVRGVYQFLYSHSTESEAATRALNAYNADKIRWPYGPLPEEYERLPLVDAKLVPYVKDPTAFLPVGTLAQLQVEAEKLRLKQGGDELNLDAKDLNLSDFKRTLCLDA